MSGMPGRAQQTYTIDRHQMNIEMDVDAQEMDIDGH